MHKWPPRACLLRPGPLSQPADYTVRPTGGAYNLFLISRASFSAHSSYAHPVGHHQEVMHTKGKLFETPTTNFSGWYARPIAPYRRPVRAGFQSIQRQRDANLSFPSCMHTAQIGPLGCAPTPGQKNQNLLRRKRLFSLRAAGALSASMLYVQAYLAMPCLGLVTDFSLIRWASRVPDGAQGPIGGWSESLTGPSFEKISPWLSDPSSAASTRRHGLFHEGRHGPPCPRGPD